MSRDGEQGVSVNVLVPNMTFGRAPMAKKPMGAVAPMAFAWPAKPGGASPVEPVSEQVFRAEHETEGRMAINADSSTPIFSPHTGRVTKLRVSSQSDDDAKIWFCHTDVDRKNIYKHWRA